MIRRLIAAVAILATVAACGGDPVEPETAGEVVATEAPEATEDEPAAATIPGIAAVDVYGNLEARGFTCERGDNRWSCRSEEGDVTLSAGAVGTGPSSITEVSADAMVVGGDADATAVPFFGFLSTLPYEGADPDAATAWIEATIGQNATAPFGPVAFTLGAPSAFMRTLTMRPVAAP